MEPVVRDARLTDIDRITGLMERADSRWSAERLRDAGDVLRRLIYLPNAALIVAVDGRTVVGASMLALRPSAVAAGLVGNIDFLVVEPGHELDGVVDVMLRELVRQARNKGCVTLEGEVPSESEELTRWEAAGFNEAGPRMSVALVRSTAAVW